MDDYILRNRADWNTAAAEYHGYGERLWQSEPRWGVYGIPETQLGVLPTSVAGKDVLEAGCGTGYVSAWLAKMGAHPVGLDNSPEQLASAAEFQQAFEVSFPLVWGVAEAMPFRDQSFDLVISEYGAVLWSDPYVWVPEAARVLRPGGELIMLTNSVFVALTAHDDETVPVDEVLKRPYFGLHRIGWPGNDGVEFHLNHGDWVRVLGDNGLAVTDLIEVQVPPGAETSYPWASAEWGRRYPIEEVWKATKT